MNRALGQSSPRDPASGPAPNLTLHAPSDNVAGATVNPGRLVPADELLAEPAAKSGELEAAHPADITRYAAERVWGPSDDGDRVRPRGHGDPAYAGRNRAAVPCLQPGNGLSVPANARLALKQRC